MSLFLSNFSSCRTRGSQSVEHFSQNNYGTTRIIMKCGEMSMCDYMLSMEVQKNIEKLYF